ncbi:selenocysteine-specific translation elongation factor [soil metagenome]
MSAPRHFIVGTAGHIDHGKSTLVRTLTGTDPDRLPEEKARGLTIDLGFAHLSLDGLELGVVDVPGHSDFVKNMVAGIGAIDLAVIVVAADDSWMPQTEEHVQILGYLGIRRAVVALTKADLVDELDLELATEDVRLHLDGTPFAEIPIIPVSAPAGTGLDPLRDTIAQILRNSPDTDDIGKPRLHVDRAFSPPGVGTVVTGTLVGGQLAKGTRVTIAPGALEAKVRTVQNHGSEVPLGHPGSRIALNIPEVALAAAAGRKGIGRGQTATLAALATTTDTIAVELSRSGREIVGQPATAAPLKTGKYVRVHLGSADLPARIFFLDTSELPPGGRALAQLRFDTPAHAFVGDCFVIRDWARRGTVGGGVVLDVSAHRRKFRNPAQRAFLEARAAAPLDPAVLLGSLLARDRVVALPTLVRSLVPEEAVEAAIAASGAILKHPMLIDATYWAETLAALRTKLSAYHDAHPDRPGMPAASLRGTLRADLFEAACEEFARVPGGFRHPDFTARLPPELGPVRTRLLDALSANPIEPPSPKELLKSDGDRRAFSFLVSAGEVIDLDEKCALTAPAFAQLRTTILTFLDGREPASASEIRAATGTTRRVLIPLLERFDRDGITRRQGDLRSLPPKRAPAG